MTPREEWGDEDRTDRQLEAPDAGPRFAELTPWPQHPFVPGLLFLLAK